MKYRKILLILAIATLSLTACKKEEKPAPAKTEIETTTIEETTEPETDENMETITNADRGYAKAEEVEAPATETELPADVDLGAEYTEPIKETVEPDYESMTKDERIEAATKDLVDDIINRYIQEQAQQNHIPVDDSDWGEKSTGELTDPTDWDAPRDQSLAGDFLN